MRLFIIIPAYNEEKTITQVIAEIPSQLVGVDSIEVVVVDDGSIDETSQRALSAGVKQLIRHKTNQGLAISFRDGLDLALKRGADIIVNTDADHQYNQQEIASLIKPILDNRADIVVGDRQVKNLAYMPFTKKYGNLLGSWIVGRLSGLYGIDASSGFRAFSREAAMKLGVFFGHTYTHQTLIEAAHKKLVVKSVPVEFRARQTGSSRLIQGTLHHIRISLFIIIRTMLVYKPLKTFIYLGSVFIFLSFVLGLRFLYHYLFGSGAGKTQSLILTAILIILGIVMYAIGFLGDLISLNRQIGEEVMKRLKQIDYDKHE